RLVDRPSERLETPAARQLQRRVDVPHKAEGPILLVDVECQRHRFDDAVVGIGPEDLRPRDLLVPLVRRSNLAPIEPHKLLSLSLATQPLALVAGCHGGRVPWCQRALVPACAWCQRAMFRRALVPAYPGASVPWCEKVM